MRILIVAAMDENRLIGNDGRLPWPFLPNDHAHVQRLVKGRKTIMGRKSYDTPDRIWSDAGNIVMTSQPNYQVDPGFEVVHSMEEAFERYKDEDEIVVLGGAQIYAETIPRASVLYLTLIHGTYEGDAYFPDFRGFGLTAQEDHPADERHPVAYSFQTWERQHSIK